MKYLRLAASPFVGIVAGLVVGGGAFCSTFYHVVSAAYERTKYPAKNDKRNL